ncbi:type 1 glutamine amidotransferase [Mariprofundus ferrooxydans]|uniref:type 1 glutamine amidotransferase n=1 Tax=Mariprofundus ferrooxydans TaxID=314344 RepID=UPI00036FC1DA|nr:type 1 glutamine amidotransferase [Mariprofundus ferrooxydans]
MKPVRIISHAAIEHPGYLCSYLEERGVCYEKIYITQGAPLPKELDDVSGLVFLGSPLSVNDTLPWIAEELSLIRQASQKGIPVLGICFGGQLISKAFGGEIRSAPEMQIGWHRVTLSECAKDYFTNHRLMEDFFAFEWHRETFSLPNGALPLFNGGCIRNQGFIYKKCLALQFHLEITKPMVNEWLAKYSDYLKNPSECTQSKEQILENIDAHLTYQQMVANDIFSWWLDLTRDSRRSKESLAL